jgi:RHS repeat-associated protein
MQSQPTTLLCRYRYDPLDRLISHALSQTPERQRFYCKSRLSTGIQGALKYSIVQQGDLLLAQQRVEVEVIITTLLATDQQRSVLQTLNVDHPPQPIAYSPYGHRLPENGLLSLLGFNGEWPDPLTGHYLLGNGYRAFNPALMRFNSPDSLSPFAEGGFNPYTYCEGDPVNMEDPTGHFALRPTNWLDNIQWAKTKALTWKASAPRKTFITTRKIARVERKKTALNEAQRIENWKVEFTNQHSTTTRLITLPGESTTGENLALLNEMTILNKKGEVTGIKSGPFLNLATRGQTEMANRILNTPHPTSPELEWKIRRLLGNHPLPDGYSSDEISRIRRESFKPLNNRDKPQNSRNPLDRL